MPPLHKPQQELPWPAGWKEELEELGAVNPKLYLFESNYPNTQPSWVGWQWYDKNGRECGWVGKLALPGEEGTDDERMASGQRLAVKQLKKEKEQMTDRLNEAVAAIAKAFQYYETEWILRPAGRQLTPTEADVLHDARTRLRWLLRQGDAEGFTINTWVMELVQNVRALEQRWKEADPQNTWTAEQRRDILATIARLTGLVTGVEGRRARVQGDSGRSGRKKGTIAWWEHIEAWEGYAKKYGRRQSPETIDERQGFSYGELTEFLGHEPTTWKEADGDAG